MLRKKSAHEVSFVAPVGAGVVNDGVMIDEPERCPFCLTRSMLEHGMDPHEHQSSDHHSVRLVGRRLVYGCWPSFVEVDGGGWSEGDEVDGG